MAQSRELLGMIGHMENIRTRFRLWMRYCNLYKRLIALEHAGIPRGNVLCMYLYYAVKMTTAYSKTVKSYPDSPLRKSFRLPAFLRSFLESDRPWIGEMELFVVSSESRPRRLWLGSVPHPRLRNLRNKRSSEYEHNPEQPKNLSNLRDIFLTTSSESYENKLLKIFCYSVLRGLIILTDRKSESCIRHAEELKSPNIWRGLRLPENKDHSLAYPNYPSC